MTEINTREIAAHVYLSTACWHAIQDGDAEMHTACRNVCKYCDGSCRCPCHGDAGTQPGRTSQVDQARDIARELFDYVHPNFLDPALAERIRTDPALFWLRGEEAPTGQWTPPEETP